VHDPEFAPSVEVILNETLPALQKLKEEGKIRLIGMTGYPLALQQVRQPITILSNRLFRKMRLIGMTTRLRCRCGSL
jgi:aryl-alcohol dehydrogenase-like predicted oxidoreductase